MSFSLSDTFFVIVIFQLLFTSVFLFTHQKGRRISNTLLGAFFLFLAWLLPRAMTWRTILRTVEWKLTDEGVEIQSEVSSTRIRWEAFIKSREDQKVFLLYVQKNSAQFIPKRVLSAEQLGELRDIVSRHVKKV